MRVWFAVVALVCILLLSACGGTATQARTVTMDGRDSTGIIVDPINVWDNYETRARVVARVKHGDRVTLIRQDGNGALIRTSAGVEGWVTKTFIQELR